MSRTTGLALLLVRVLTAGGFELAGPKGVARIVVPPAEPECVGLAAQDLVNDVRTITGRTVPIVQGYPSCRGDCVVVASAAFSASTLRETAPAAYSRLAGKWEAYLVETAPVGLLIAGSDERGAMFGVYAFIEQYLGVDPMYFWTDRAPAKRSRLGWDRVRIWADEPTFRFRGWFLNDEDLLVEWKPGGGKRHIEYPYYHQVAAPEVLARVYEAMLRLQYNLVIPASFTDITNPDEERMVREATRRGLFVSMHHVEPLGVSGFAFQNYWRLRGRNVAFSFLSRRPGFEEIWRFYACRWARYSNVVWQLGLRGIGDRPVWASDPSVPESDQARGRLICEAMARQWEIVRSVDRRPDPPATTTLWMEGSELHRRGHLRFPPGVAVIFSDNSPGWKLQPDFHETPREPGRSYGIYYHHALWGSGPHLVQAVSPHKTHEIFRRVVERGDTYYALLNVSNVREFALGVDASARMLRDFEGFDPDRYFARWCRQRFGGVAHSAEQAYRHFSEAYVVDGATGLPVLLDGQILHAGQRVFSRLLSAVVVPSRSDETEDLNRLLSLVQRERAAMEAAAAEASAVRASLRGPGRALFETNLAAQQKILLGLLRWLEAGIRAARAQSGAEALKYVEAALDGIKEVRGGQALASRGAWKDWYRGDRKMNLDRAEALTRQLLDELRQRHPSL